MNRRAFTLLELLLAVSITAITAGLLYAVMQAGATASRVTAQASGDVRRLVLALDHMEQALQSAKPPRGLLAGAMTGDDQSMESHDALQFHTVIDPIGSDWGDIFHIAYQLEADAAGGLQLMELTTRNLLAPGETPTEAQVLCRGVGSLNFRYFDGSGWFDSWDSTQLGNLLPVAIEITLALEAPVSPNAELLTAPQVRRVITLPCAIGQEVVQ